MFLGPTKAAIEKWRVSTETVEFVLIFVRHFSYFPLAGIIGTESEVGRVFVLRGVVVAEAGVGEIAGMKIWEIWVGAVDTVDVFFFRYANKFPEAGIIGPKNRDGVIMLFGEIARKGELLKAVQATICEKEAAGSFERVN